ncbi:unnamed protein product, partial [Symbiodinium microadriaticum]
QVPSLMKNWAITQVHRCADRNVLMHLKNMTMTRADKEALAADIWGPCSAQAKSATEISLMGYSMRTSGYRYTGYVHFDRNPQRGTRGRPRVIMDELYDHTKDKEVPLAERETVNVASAPDYQKVRETLKSMLSNILMSGFNKNISYTVV